MRVPRALAWLLAGLIAPRLASAVHVPPPGHAQGIDTVPPFNRREDHVLLYQYGKVGSTAMEKGIGGLLDPPGNVKYVTDALAKAYPRATKAHNREPAAHVLSQVPAGRTVWVITMTRVPFFRDVSAYFQNIERWFSQREVLNANMSVLHEHFRSTWHASNSPDRFFSSDFYNVTGVNLLHYADRLAGHETSSGEDHIFVRKPWSGAHIDLNIILLKFENIARWEHSLQRYFPGIRLNRANEGKRKWYGQKYVKFLNSYSFSRREVDTMCNGDTMSFYTEGERQYLAPQCDPSRAATAARRFWRIDRLGRVHLNAAKLSFTVCDLNVEEDDRGDE